MPDQVIVVPAVADQAPDTVAEPRWRGAGHSTAAGGVVAYRLAKLAAYGPVTGRWLDCGSCDGSYTRALLEHGASAAVGIEVDPARAADAARSRAPRAAGMAPVAATATATSTGASAPAPQREAPRFAASCSEALPFPAAVFDGVLVNEVLEHVDDQVATLAELARVLRPGGRLVLFSPNRWFPFEGHGARVGAREVGFPVPLLPWLPRRITAPVMQARNYWPRELRDLVEGAGFTVAAVDFAMPLLSHYPWMPRRLAERYRVAVPRLERHRAVRRFGVSTLVVAVRP